MQELDAYETKRQDRRYILKWYLDKVMDLKEVNMSYSLDVDVIRCFTAHLHCIIDQDNILTDYAIKQAYDLTKDTLEGKLQYQYKNT